MILKLKEKYKEDIYKTGIYKISIINTEYFYIGLATSNGKFNCQKGFYRRWVQHIRQIKNGTHRNRFLKRIFEKYDISVFKFEILEIIEDRKKCIEREYELINSLKPPLNFTYNKQSIPEVRLTDQQRKAISDRQIGKKHTQETKDKISISNKGNTNNKRVKIIISKKELYKCIKNINHKCSTLSLEAERLNFKTKHNIIISFKHHFPNEYIGIFKKARENSYKIRGELSKVNISYTQEDIKFIIKLYRSGMYIKNIREEINLNEDLLGKIIRDNIPIDELKLIRSKNMARK